MTEYRLVQRRQSLAYALGLLRNAASPKTNHAVTAFTQGAHPGAGKVQFQTVSDINLVAADRFVTFSVDAAELNCDASHAMFEFYLKSGSSRFPLFSPSCQRPAGRVSTGCASRACGSRTDCAALSTRLRTRGYHAPQLPLTPPGRHQQATRSAERGRRPSIRPPGTIPRAAAPKGRDLNALPNTSGGL